MKTYIDFGNKIYYNNWWIVKDLLNSNYRSILKEIEDGEAELIPYTPPAPTWEQIRAQRDQLLVQSDWTTLPDAQPKPNKEAWLNYRQALRDITKTYSSPEAVIWPTKPA